MQKNIQKPASALLGPAVLLLSTVMLSACTQDDFVMEDQYVPATHYEMHPITVKKAPVGLGISHRAGKLSPEQINAATNFAQDARSNAQSKVSILWPSGGTKARQAAHDIAELFVEESVPKAMIHVGSYSGSASSPIRISYLRKVAVTNECGDWSDNLAYNPDNAPNRNFGCAHQHNIAAMVSNPEDFERPRAMSPTLAANRTAAMAIYLGAPQGDSGAKAATPAVSTDPAADSGSSSGEGG